MPFSRYEITHFEKFIRSDDDCVNLAQHYLDKDDYEFLRTMGMLHLVNDRLHVPKTRHKHNSITITKLLTPDIAISDFIDDVCKPLSRQYEIKIDCGFIVVKNDLEEVDKQYSWPQRSTNINPTTKIFTPADKINLRQFLKHLTPNDYLNISFLKKSEYCLFEKSGYRPHCLLTLTLYITK